MNSFNKIRFGILLLLFSGCVSAPEIVPGKGAVYGIVQAKSHKAILDKAAKSGDSYSGWGVQYNSDMINYANLNELYACIILPDFHGGNEHVLAANPEGMSLRSLAIAKGDRIKIANKHSKALTFFITDNKDGFQEFGLIPAGEEKIFTVNLAGDLELSTDEDQRLVTALLSRNGLIAKRLSSGEAYAFERLNPGSYDVIFWFWRLGQSKHAVEVQPGKNARLDQVLSVDQLIK